jgi:NTP-dependent ternary conflict system VMAP-like protein
VTPARTHAVVVGLEEYEFGAGRVGMAAQALAFAKWLRERGVPKDNIVLLTSPLLKDSDGFLNRPAHSAAVQNMLHRDVFKLECDTFWLHWGGHGMVDEAGQRRLFLQDATTDDFRNINLDRLLALLQSRHARSLGRQIVTVDACQKFPGQKAPRLPDGIPVPPGHPPVPGAEQEIIFASPLGRRAVHLSRLGGGLFSAALLDCLAEDTGPAWPPDVRALPRAVERRVKLLAPNDPGAAQPIQVVYGDQDGLREPVNIVPAPPSTTLLYSSRAELSTLLAETGAVDPSTIVDTLWRALRAVSPIPVSDAVDLETVVDRLDRLPCRPRRLPPVLSFIEYLAARLSDPGPLRSWVDAVAEELEVDIAAVSQARADAALDTADAATFVTVKVEPMGGTTDTFTLNAALERDGASLTLRLDDQLPCLASEVRERCETMVSRVAKFLPRVRGDALTFEFLLPWSLLNAAVHRWRPASGGVAGGQLGLRGKVVVRSLDRLRFDGLAWRDWEERWNRLGAGESQILFLHLSSALPQYYDSAESAHLIVEQHDAETLADRFLLAEDAACVVLSYPYRQRIESAVDGLQIALAAGMPVAVWCGIGCDPAPLKDVVEELCKTRGLAGLPERVYQERRDARAAGADHYGRDVTLLWDDPHRIPELTEPLTAPARGGKVA